MPQLGVTTLVGSSGKSYEFNVYSKGTIFNDFIPVVYAIAQQNQEGHQYLFVGESDNVRPALDGHEKLADFEAAGYDTILFHRDARADVRQAVVTDLAEALSPSHQ